MSIFTIVTKQCLKNGKRGWLFFRTPFCSEIKNVEGTVAVGDKEKLSGFAKAFTRHTNINSETNVDNTTFSHLFRHSKFVDLGDPRGKIVTGRVFHVVNDDLYIDFGWKFHCVCPRPTKNGGDYVRGSIVRLKIKHLELSTKFLGYERDLTLLEADCTLLGLLSTPTKATIKRESKIVADKKKNQ